MLTGRSCRAWTSFHQHRRRGKRPAETKDIDLLILCLDPRQELRFKANRERIDWSNFLGSLIHHRLFHHRPTWVLTPRRIDDPEFIAIYGHALAGLLDTDFTPLRFGQTASTPVVRRRSLNPGFLRWLDDRPSEMVVHPETGVVSIPGVEQPVFSIASKDVTH